jgi:hypothetical protein
MKIQLKACSFEIQTEGRSMEEIFNVPKSVIRTIKSRCAETKSLQDVIHYMVREGEYTEALVLLVGVWNTLKLEKERDD